MKGRHHVLIAAQPAAWQVLQTILNGVADVHPAHTVADAFKILERERIDLIVCTIAFDESQMMQFLESVKRTISAGRIPFLCARVLPGIVRDSLVPSIRDGCKALGAADLVDIARLPPEHAQAAMRSAVEASLQ
jgi:DNA-binding NarL/FixJ family response regulator